MQKHEPKVGRDTDLEDESDWDQEQTIVSFAKRDLAPPHITELADVSGGPGNARPADHLAPRIGPPGWMKKEDEKTTIEPLNRPSPLCEPASEDQTVCQVGTAHGCYVGIKALLVILQTPRVQEGNVFTLDHTRTDIGRGRRATIFLSDPSISILHATVCCETGLNVPESRFVLYDLASTNGTFVNGERVNAPILLKDGDRIVLGETELAFKQI